MKARSPLSAWLVMLPLLLGLLGTLVPGATVLAAQRPLDVAQLALEPLSLTEHFAVLEDPLGRLEVSDVTASALEAAFSQRQAPAWSLKFGVTASAYWLKLSLKNSGAKPFEGMLEFAYPRLASSVQVFMPTGSGSFSVLRTGYLQPFSERPYKHHFYVFPLTVAAGAETTLYLRFQSDVNLEIPGRLWRSDAFHAYERTDYASQALYFGMVVAMMGFNLLLFIALRARQYLWYVCFGVSSALSVAALNGLAVEYLWGNSPYWTNISASVGYSATLVLGIIFMRSMIETRKLVPRLDLALRFALVAQLALALGIAISYVSVIKWQLAAAGATSLLALWTGVLCAVKRDRSAIFFCAAFAVMAMGAAANSLRALGFIPTTFFSTNGIQIGSAIEMLLLAFALADRYNVIRIEKEHAQRQALLAQQQLVESLQSSERQLESRVARRTDELTLLNAKLEALSATDSLTGLANRRRFDELLEAEWRRGLRERRPLSVGILDVDWFKKYNDCYGHVAGDQCLQQIAKVLSASVCRAGDLAARYGGEEFAFIAVGADAQSVLALAQRICESLVQSRWQHESSEFGCVTASVGVASIVPTEDASPLDLLKAADEALYQAKEQGRNRALLHVPGSQRAWPPRGASLEN